MRKQNNFNEIFKVIHSKTFLFTLYSYNFMKIIYWTTLNHQKVLLNSSLNLPVCQFFCLAQLRSISTFSPRGLTPCHTTSDAWKLTCTQSEPKILQLRKPLVLLTSLRFRKSQRKLKVHVRLAKHMPSGKDIFFVLFKAVLELSSKYIVNRFNSLFLAANVSRSLATSCYLTPSPLCQVFVLLTSSHPNCLTPQYFKMLSFFNLLTFVLRPFHGTHFIDLWFLLTNPHYWNTRQYQIID